MNILAPIDFSETTEAVLEQTRRLADALQAEVWLLHVAAPNPAFVGYETGPQSVRDQMAEVYHQEHRQLQGHAEALRAEGLAVTALLAQGATVETILEEAERRAASLIILGSHGHGALYHLLLGSVSEGVLRRTRCPVVVVPAEGREA